MLDQKEALSAADKILEYARSLTGREYRKPEHKGDFGDEKTIGLTVRKIDGKFSVSKADCTGFFVGKHKGRYCIAFRELAGCVSYPSLESLKEDWELD